MMTKFIKLASMVTKKDGLKKIGKVIIGAILAPFILIIALLTSSADAAVQHNNAVIDTVFNQSEIPASVPKDFRQYIYSMQSNFKELDVVIGDVQKKIKKGALDPIQVKALFFAVYFGNDNIKLSKSQLSEYVQCFVKYEIIEVESDKEEAEDKKSDEDNESVIKTEEVAIVVTDIRTIKSSIEATLNIQITDDQMKNYEQIYKIVNPGANASTSGDGSYMKDLLKEAIENSETKPYVGGSPGSPFEDDWRNKITSEFGNRFPVELPDGTIISDPHTGMDLGNGTPLGTSILAVNDGTVVYVRNHEKGLGLHLAIDHGGGVLTVYGHTSRILVQEGDTVKKGQKIAEVGSTGFSTGPHLHLEYWLHGKVHDPREYLE